MFCPNCGKPNDENSAFCGWCGTTLKQFNSNSEHELSKETYAPTDMPAEQHKSKEVQVEPNKQELDEKNVNPEETDEPSVNSEPEMSNVDEVGVDEHTESILEKKKKPKGWIVGLLTVIVLVAGGLCFFFNQNSSETPDPEAIPKAEYASSLLKGLNACGPVYKISISPKAFYFMRNGECIDGAITTNNGYELSLGDPVEGQVDIGVEEDHITDIAFTQRMALFCTQVEFKFTHYDALGLPTKADLIGDGDLVASDVSVKCSDFDSYGNWTCIDIDKPESSHGNELISEFPSEIVRSIEYWTDEMPDLVPLPSDTELELILKLAHKLDKTAVTNELASLREQAMNVPCNVWEGGFEYFDRSNVLFFGGEEPPLDFHVVSINKHPNYRESKFFAYVTLETGEEGDNIYTSYHLVYLRLEDGRWKVCDVDNMPANEYYGEHSMIEDMKAFINKANDDIVSGVTENDVKEVFSNDEERMNMFLTEISDYRSKYNI